MAKHVKAWVTNAIGHCDSCGESLRGDGLEIGARASDTICVECALDITRLTLAREGRVSVPAEFKSDPVKYLTEHGFLDGRGRVKPEHLTNTKTN